MKARVSNLTKTEAEWTKLNFKPLPGELIVYTPEASDSFACTKLKIGDGVHMLHELPFVIDYTANAVLENYKRVDNFDAGRITEYF